MNWLILGASARLSNQTGYHALIQSNREGEADEIAFTAYGERSAAHSHERSLASERHRNLKCDELANPFVLELLEEIRIA